MEAHPGLTVALSQLLVAFTIEFDNEFEHRMPHRSSTGHRDRTRGPWLTSQAMWANFLQYMPPEGIPLGQLPSPRLGGLERWGYLVVEPDPADQRVRPPRRDWIVRPTPGCTRAQGIWAPLAEEIEQRWSERGGVQLLSGLRTALADLTNRFADLIAPGGSRPPDYLPIVWNELFGDPVLPRSKASGSTPPVRSTDGGAPALSALLARVLLGLTRQVEQGSEVSMTVGLNVLRLLTDNGTHLGALPAATGVSKEGVSMAMTALTRHRLVELRTSSVGPGRDVHLTARGRSVRREFLAKLTAVEDDWRARAGSSTIDQLIASARGLLSAEGLHPYPEGWRAQRPYLTQTERVLQDPENSLPHYPMVLHRGGWPDGS